MKRTQLFRVVVFFACWLASVQACSLPDERDFGPLVNAVGAMSKADKVHAKRWRLNWQAQEWLADRNPNELVALIECEDGVQTDAYEAMSDEEADAWLEAGNEVKSDFITYTVGDILRCLFLNAGQFDGSYTLRTCLEKDTLDTARRELSHTLADPRCYFPLFQDHWMAEQRNKPLIPKELDAPELVKERDIAEGLVQSTKPPAWLPAALQTGAAAGAGVILFRVLPALCALQEGGGHDWSCPGNPLYPPGMTPEPPGPGQPGSGDHL